MEPTQNPFGPPAQAESSSVRFYNRQPPAFRRPAARFANVPIGGRFRLPGRTTDDGTPLGYIGGIYIKTGERTYGLRPGEPLWTWFQPSTTVEPTP